jgi:hypothetical protein
MDILSIKLIKPSVFNNLQLTPQIDIYLNYFNNYNETITSLLKINIFKGNQL